MSKKYGAISAKGIELTGVTTCERLNVISVTKRERNMNPNIPTNMYVIENITIEGIIALQDETGKVYTVTSNKIPKLICNSLSEYIEKSNLSDKEEEKMNSIEFGKKCRPYNIQYRDIFGYVPCRDDYNCSQDEYFNALLKSIETKCELYTIIPKKNKDFQNANKRY